MTRKHKANVSAGALEWVYTRSGLAGGRPVLVPVHSPQVQGQQRKRRRDSISSSGCIEVSPPCRCGPAPGGIQPALKANLNTLEVWLLVRMRADLDGMGYEGSRGSACPSASGSFTPICPPSVVLHACSALSAWAGLTVTRRDIVLVSMLSTRSRSRFTRPRPSKSCPIRILLIKH